MSLVQSIVKYFAVALAIVIVLSIIAGIYTLGNYFFGDAPEITEVKEIYTYDNNISDLDIKINYAVLNIKTGSFKIESNSSKIEVKEKNNKLIIEDKNKDWFNLNGKDVVLNVYVPMDYSFDNIKIKAGAGKVYIEELSGKKVKVDLGAGDTKIKSIMVEKSFDLDAGASKLTINNGFINNLDFDLGVGETVINARIKGDSKIDCGVGKTTVNLLGEESDYKIKVDKGIGSVILKDKDIASGKWIGNGPNKVAISGGVGELNINIKQ